MTSQSGERLILAGLAAAILLLGCHREVPTSHSGRRDVPVILVSIDTLRADHVGCYGSSVETPNLDSLAGDSILFENAWAQVPLTLPSHVSVLTGLLPAATGVRSNLGYRFDATAHPTLPSILRERGYWAGAAVSAYVLRSGTGLGPLFDAYSDEVTKDEAWSVGGLQRPGEETVHAASRMLENVGERPFFFLLHLFEPHSPYEPPEPFRSRYPDDAYAGEISAADAALGSFLQELKAKGVYERALIIAFSDHGEGLDDHGEAEHGIFLYREAIHVPLLVKMPGLEMAGARVATPAQLADIMPTVAELIGFQVPNGVDGVSLIDLARGARPDRRIFSETMYPRIHLGWSDLVSLVDQSHHYIDAPRPELFDILADPGEQANVITSNRRVYAAMRNEAGTYPRDLTPPSDIDKEEQEKLRALGYLGGTSPNSNMESLPDPKDQIADLSILGKATAATRRGDYDAAIPLLLDLTTRNPGFADAWTLLAKSYDSTGNESAAIEAYSQAIRVAPALAAGTSLSVAEIALRNGRLEECIEHAELALESHPDSASILLARAFLAKKDFASTEKYATRLLSSRQHAITAQVILAQARIGQKRYDEALSMLDAAGQAAQSAGQPPVPNIFLARADALALMGRLEEAERSLGYEINYFPRNKEAYVRLVALQTLSGRDEEATRTLEDMVRKNPESSSYDLAAQTLLRLGKKSAAAEWLERRRKER